MRVTDFAFELPESLIAHYPMPERSSCRLLSLDGPTGALTHGTFTDILDKLNPGDLLVFNNTRVIPARLFGRKASGGKIEVLGIVTEAVSRYSTAKIIGLCNVPINMQHMIVGMLGAQESEVKLRFAGLNHMVWVHKVLQGREDVTGKVIDMLCDGKALSMNNIKELPWPAEFLRALKAIPCPYHRYFWLTPAMLAEEIAAAKTKGTRAEQVMKVEQELFALYADPQLEEKPEQLSFRGGAYYSEVAVELINAIYNNLGAEMVVNTRNNGAIHGLDDDAVVETNSIIDAQGARPLAFGPLPPAMNGLTQQVKAFERLTIEAAVHGCRESALLALVTNPLVGNVTDAQALLDEVLTINRQWLTQFN